MPCDLCEVEPAGTNVNVEKLTKPQKINYYLVQKKLLALKLNKTNKQLI